MTCNSARAKNPRRHQLVSIAINRTPAIQIAPTWKLNRRLMPCTGMMKNINPGRAPINMVR